MNLSSECTCSDVVLCYLIICHVGPNYELEIQGHRNKTAGCYRNLSFQRKPQLSFPELLLLTEVIHLTFFKSV